jgi:hypothetical protein
MEGDELGKNFFLYELGTWEGRYTTVACVKKLKAFDVLVRCFFFFHLIQERRRRTRPSICICQNCLSVRLST